jgi:hypothetical protein
METRDRNIFLLIVINVSVVGWSVYFAHHRGVTVLFAVLLISLVIANVVLLKGEKSRE